MKKDAAAYRVGDVAKLLGTSDQSVRSWSNEFAALLGPGAVPDRNVERRYTDQDVRALALIQERKRLREAHDAIVQALQTAIADDNLPDLPEMPLAGDVPASVVTQARETWMIQRASLQADISRLESDRQRLEDKLEREQDGRRADIERLMREIADLRAQLAAQGVPSPVASSVQPQAPPQAIAEDKPRRRWPWSS